MLGSLVENIEGEFEESSKYDNQKLDKLCVTRWTIRAKCFKKFLNNYKALWEWWKQSLKENLNFHKKNKNCGLQKPKENFQVLFRPEFNPKFVCNHGQAFKQHEKMSALRGKDLADLTVQTLENMRNEHNFTLLYKN